MNYLKKVFYKGDNRGLGLSTLKEITDNNDNVLLDTVIENGFLFKNRNNR